ALQLMKKIPEAIAAFDAAESQGLRSFGLYYHRGAMRAQSGQFDGAIDDLKLAAEKAPDARLRAHSHTMRGDAAMRLQRYDVAVEAYGALLRDDPSNYDVRIGLAMAQLGRQDLAAAGEILEALLAEKPHHAAYYGRALWHRAHGRSQAAAADLDRAIEL